MSPFFRSAWCLNMKMISGFVAWLGLVTMANACDFNDVLFHADFPMGRLNHCEQISPQQFTLHFQPENRPINSSAWYAFQVKSTTPQTLSLTLTFDGDLPRYLPKISRDGQTWQTIPFATSTAGFEIAVEVDKQPLWIAGQELITNQTYADWFNAQKNAAKNKTERRFFELGRSTQGRHIQAITSLAENSNEWVILIGRQHPPEVTGALAMLPFVENLLSDSTMAKQFRQRFNLLIVPNVNPDGVAAGNWRHNTRGKDLNRDWNQFEQTETRLIHNVLQKLVQDKQKIVFALDFHSTQEDVFYTIPSDAGIVPKDLANLWLDTINQQTNRFFKVRNKPGNSPGRGIFKQYIADTYRVHGVTFELGDNTNRQLIKQIATVSAQTFMSLMTSTDPSDFYLPEGSEQ